RGREFLHQGEGREPLAGRHLGKDGAGDGRELGERGGQAWIDAREGAQQRGTSVGGQFPDGRRKLAVEDARPPRRGGRERARGREEERALLRRPLGQAVGQGGEEGPLLGLARERRARLGPRLV